MTKSKKNIIIILLFTILFSSVVNAEESSQKAKLILEKFFIKYEKIFSDRMSNANSLICRMSIKGVSRFDTNRSSANAPLLIDTKADLYVSNSNKILVNLKGNMGNIVIIVSDKNPNSAVTLFPDSKQFAMISFSERIFGGIKSVNRERFWNENVLTYAGLTNTTRGKVHKIIVKSNKKTEKEVTTIHIIDGKWDPFCIEYSNSLNGSTSINFDQIQFNANIPPEKFIPNTKGYTQVSKEQIAGIIMMNIMASNMVKKPIK